MHQPAHVIGLTELEEVSLSRNGQVSGRQGKPSNQSLAPVTRTLPLFPLSSVQKMASHRSLHGTTALFYISIKIIQRDLSAICNLGKEIHRQHYNTIQRHQFIICSTIIILNKQWTTLSTFHHIRRCASSQWARQQVERISWNHEITCRAITWFNNPLQHQPRTSRHTMTQLHVAGAWSIIPLLLLTYHRQVEAWMPLKF